MISIMWSLGINGKDELFHHWPMINQRLVEVWTKRTAKYLLFCSLLSEHLFSRSWWVPIMTSFEPWLVLSPWTMHGLWIVCTQRMSISSFVKGHGMGWSTDFPSSKHSILGCSFSFSDKLVTNKHTYVCWRKAGKTSRNSIWPPLSYPVTIKELLWSRCVCNLVSSAAFVVCCTSESGPSLV